MKTLLAVDGGCWDTRQGRSKSFYTQSGGTPWIERGEELLAATELVFIALATRVNQ